jgi:glycosyltransferase involved in cell wall biosynthesis
MRKEASGLAYSTLELAKYEEKQGHQVGIRQPSEHMPIYGRVNGDCDIHSVHSQLNMETYTDRKPKFMWMHGEPLSSVGNGVSMKAIVDLAPRIDAFICMRREEHQVWSSIKKTYLVQKGIDLERFHKIPEVVEKLSGEPAVLYAEHWRGQRNPLYLCLAMEKVHQKYPNARLHLYNCTDTKMRDCFDALIKNNKWWTFIRSLQGPQEDVNLLYNKVDIVVSCLYPLYARGIEAFGAGKAFIGPGYREYADYPWTCDLDPDSMADAIIKCHENYDKVDYRKWAEDKHDVATTVKQTVDIYQRYL